MGREKKGKMKNGIIVEVDHRAVEPYLGCMFGLAIGDALGAPVEFMSWAKIQRDFGTAGVTDLDRRGLYTDDTQMSLATAQALIKIQPKSKSSITSNTVIAHNYYLQWLSSQSNVHQRRSPGNTCIRALQSGKIGTLSRPINNSKGCGGVMRTAPVGLAFSSGELAFRRGAEFAAITHGHPSGYLSAGFLSELIFHLSIGDKSLSEAIQISRKTLLKYSGHEETLHLVDRACSEATKDTPIVNAIEAFGSGWTGEEALAISLLCALRFPTDWKSAVLAAVNHSGDSDSTGSITGAIIGTLLGIDSIPSDWICRVENSNYIRAVANALHKNI